MIAIAKHAALKRLPSKLTTTINNDSAIKWSKTAQLTAAWCKVLYFHENEWLPNS
jgi:hypothetical protein